MESSQLELAVEKAIVDLSILIKEDSLEAPLQQFLEENECVFQSMGFRSAIPHPEIIDSEGRKYIPDFIVERQDGLWQIIELKIPRTKLLKDRQRRDSWYAEMHDYLSQCEEYVEQLRDSTVLREFEAKYNVTMHRGFPVSLIAGMSESIDIVKITRILDRLKTNISLITFDQLLSGIESWCAGKYPQADNWSGVSLGLMYQLEEMQALNGCIVDLGKASDKNRITLCRKNNDILQLKVIDSNQLSIAFDFFSPDVVLRKSVLLIVNVYPSGDILRIVIEANGLQIADLRTGMMNIDLQLPAPITIGNDFENNGSACFVSGPVFTRSPSLSINEKNDLIAKFEPFSHDYKTGGGQVCGMRFKYEQFMYSEGHPYFDPLHQPTQNLVQRDLSLKPAAAS